MATVSVVFTAALVAYVSFVRARRQLREVRSKIDLEKILASELWILNYNPRSAAASKYIQFLSDGTVGEGRNENESSWAVLEGLLTIWKQDGSLQNRFRYNDAQQRFESTDEPEADAMKRGIRGQSIYRPPLTDAPSATT